MFGSNNYNIKNNSNVESSTKSLSTKGQKRGSYLGWDEYFMAMAFLELRKASNELINVAAIVLDEHKVITSIAHNDAHNRSDSASYTHHAEFQAVQKVKDGSMLYSTSFPCEKCAEEIVHKGITTVVYFHPEVECDDSKAVFTQHGVQYRQFWSAKDKIEIEFSS